MTEGWHGDDYLLLFESHEIDSVTAAYGLPRFMPGYRVLGLKSWDDFILSDQAGATFTLPTVPMVAKYLAPWTFRRPANLQPDAKFQGKIKWYIKPLAFGGSPELGDNMTWLTPDVHQKSVAWFNQMYRDLSTK